MNVDITYFVKYKWRTQKLWPSFIWAVSVLCSNEYMILNLGKIFMKYSLWLFNLLQLVALASKNSLFEKSISLVLEIWSKLYVITINIFWGDFSSSGSDHKIFWNVAIPIWKDRHILDIFLLFLNNIIREKWDFMSLELA